MANVLDRMRATIAERGLGDAESGVLLMVSGGSDSTALAYAAADLAKQKVIGPVAMLHVNHRLRGADADADQRFVQSLADLLSIPLFTCEVNIGRLADERGENVEAVARRERYLAANEALESMCRHEGVPLSTARVWTAHTQDDRVENFYMRSIVGTGPGGFRSMLYTNGPVARPCLDVSRDDLRAFIKLRAASGRAVARDADGRLWREDATNAHTDRFRAFVRHEIVPRAKERNPQLLDALCRTMNLIADEDDMLEAQTAELAARLVSWTEREGDLPDYTAGCVIAPEFATVATPLQRRVVREVLQGILGSDARVESASVEAVRAGFGPEAPVSGYVNNIQGDLALSANKHGLRIEPMAAYRARRKKDENEGRGERA
ncbi:MAG TPA: tRNA lysidine(34) synthetase TilS [Candidatus Aveggerthella excrementigallinarum]|nr:tRNA lysidine(34) synthetase TilS [Candidatus Aveggerthella excrementigallinarum]